MVDEGCPVRGVQDTVQEMAKNMKSSKTGETQASAEQLYDFMKRVSISLLICWSF
jgi:hypothetical protein